MNDLFTTSSARAIVREPFSCNRHVKKTIVKWLNESAIATKKFKYKSESIALAVVILMSSKIVVGSPDLGTETSSEYQ